MKVVTTIKEVREHVHAWRQAGNSIGLVPTMRSEERRVGKECRALRGREPYKSHKFVTESL